MSKHNHRHRNHHNGGRRGASPNPMPMRASKERLSPNRIQAAKKELRASVDQGKAAVVSEAADLKSSFDAELTAARSAAGNATQRAAAFARQAEQSMTRIAQSALASIKENPIPFALTGIGMTCTGVGLTWLLMRGGAAVASDAAAAVTGESHSPQGHGANGIGTSAQRSIKRIADEAGQLAQRAQSSVGEFAHASSDTLQRLTLDAKSRAQRLEATAEQTLRSHPLGVGASALALGVAIGWALPGTSREGRWFGAVAEKARAATAS
jgi:hypothetical protein